MGALVDGGSAADTIRNRTRRDHGRHERTHQRGADAECARCLPSRGSASSSGACSPRTSRATRCASGDLLLKQGDGDRTMYLLERGTPAGLSSRGRPATATPHVSILRAGSVVGEAGLFSDSRRMANVEAMTPCVVWALRGPRLEELAARLPNIAFELVRAAAAVMGGAHARQHGKPRRDELRQLRRSAAQQLLLGQRQRLGQARQHQRVAGRQHLLVVGPPARGRRRAAPTPPARRWRAAPGRRSARPEAGRGRRQRDAGRRACCSSSTVSSSAPWK